MAAKGKLNVEIASFFFKVKGQNVMVYDNVLLLLALLFFAQLKGHVVSMTSKRKCPLAEMSPRVTFWEIQSCPRAE